MSDDTIQRYEKMLAEDPGSRAFAPLAEAHRKAGRLDEAIRIARAGLEVHPGYSGGLVVLGRALYEKGELDNAAEILQKAVTETPESYLGQKFFGKVLIDKGENQGAMRALEAANLLSPEDEEVVRLLEEVKTRATPPKIMDYEAREADESAGKAQIVTYEQKPMTVDGVELPPLPSRGIDETFSFSGGETDDPAGVTPIVERELPPVAGPTGVVDEEGTGEDMTATVIEEEEVEQAMEIDSLDQLGPEAAAFLMEAETAVEDPMEAVSEDASPAAAEMEGRAGTEPEYVPSPEPIQESVPETLPEPLPEIESQPVDTMSESAPEPAPQATPTAVSTTPFHEPDAEKEFSTETMADLYAQQGLTEKAVGIYRKILEQDPGNEGVKLKLGALAAEAQPEKGSIREEIQTSGQGIASQPPPAVEKKDVIRVLESMLESVERIRRP